MHTTLSMHGRPAPPSTAPGGSRLRHPGVSGAFEPAAPPDVLIASMFTQRERKPYPALPRLQMTAAEERHRAARMAARAESPHSTKGRGAQSEAPPEPKFRPLTAGTAVDYATRKPEMLPAGMAAIAEGAPPAVVPTYAQMTRWFNDEKASEHAVRGKEVRPNAPAALYNPKLAERVADRKSAQSYACYCLGKKMIPVNLKEAMEVFSSNMTGTYGYLTGTQVERSLALLDIDDVLVAHKFFEVLDIYNEGRVKLATVLLFLDVAMNMPPFKDRIRKLCFNGLEHEGFIHKKDLQRWRTVVGRDKEYQSKHITPNIVRVLGDCFNVALQEEEEAFIVKLLTKGKKKRKKPPPLKPLARSQIPTSNRRTEHIPFADFDRYCDSSKDLLLAFLPVWLPLLWKDPEVDHACQQRLKSLLEAEAQRSRDVSAKQSPRSPRDGSPA